MAGFVYTRMGRRLGYGNPQNIWLVVGVTFILVTIVFYTILAFILKPN